ncbi:hypothetical protein AZE42_05172 [Rhizopogon vesiculosus]|uniref:DUF3533 domain-containing protein n=1 Tax=Rhizopogon vesiculosus TaxID=180088 RepID=A0A1J8R2Y3_9AGAM|nr:hypothetical protein AZE42_05172 [Rhizopogon vesiculosus]
MYVTAEARMRSGNSSETTAVHDQRGATPSSTGVGLLHGELFSHGFWDNDSVMTKTRQGWFKSSFIGLASIWVIIWGILPMYWGALGRWSANIHNLSAYVVDFDGGDIGQAVTLAISTIRSDSQLSYLVKDAVDFPGGTGEIAQALRNDECWVAITINPGASSNLSRAIESADATYNTTQAITAYLTSARNENLYRDVITPQVSFLLTNISQTFASRYLAGLATRQNLLALMTTSPVLVTQPLSFIMNDIVPFDVPVYDIRSCPTNSYLALLRASVVDYTGLMYMLIMSFILTLQLLSVRVETRLGQRVRLGPLIGVWACRVFHLLDDVMVHHDGAGPWARDHTHCSNDEVHTNISDPVDYMSPTFPWYIIQSKYFQQSSVGLNFGVQFAWICVSCITLPIVQSLACKHELKEWHRMKQGAQEGKIDV